MAEEKRGKVADNAFNQAVGKVRQFAEQVGKFTAEQKEYGNKVQGKITQLAGLVARLQGCKERIRGIRQALRDCESRSASALTEARAGADRAREDAVKAARAEERGRAAEALNAAAQNFDALGGALDGILTSMNAIDNIDLGALKAEVDEICAEAGETGAGGSGKGNDSGGSDEGKNLRFRRAARTVQGAEGFDRSRSGPAPQRRAPAPGGAWARGPPTSPGTFGTSKRFRGGYRYKSKTRRSPSKTAKGSKKTRRRSRRSRGGKKRR